MRNLSIVLLVAGICDWDTPSADDDSSLDYLFTLGVDRWNLEHLSLGSDPELKRLEKRDYEFEFDLDYRVDERLYLFLTVALIDETDTVNPEGDEAALDGIERRRIGAGYRFGKDLESDLAVGRMAFVDAGEWWIWWDEELDAIRLQSPVGEVSTLIALAEEQARQSTGMDFIEPGIDGLGRLLASARWEFAPEQQLALYYLDQADRSDAYVVGEFVQFERIDDVDADLAWIGISYLGEFDGDRLGEFEIELDYARVRGDATLYEFGDPSAGEAEVVGKRETRVSGEAWSYLLGWTPAGLDDWSFRFGRAHGDGDGDPDDGRDDAFRQSGLQGDSQIYGELYQPELSNLEVTLAGVEWELRDDVEIALYAFAYAQDRRAGEMRDVSIEADPSGDAHDLGRELDLVVTLAPLDGLEIRFVAAEFEAGGAYGSLDGEKSRFARFELEYEFY